MVKSDMDKEINEGGITKIEKDVLVKRLKWYTKRYGPYIEKRGLSNWKNLFRAPNNYEWTILFMLILAGFISWAYQEDTAMCREALVNLESTCINYCVSEFKIDQANEELKRDIEVINISNIIFAADNKSPDD